MMPRNDFLDVPVLNTHANRTANKGSSLAIISRYIFTTKSFIYAIKKIATKPIPAERRH